MAILISFTVISCSDGNKAPSSGNQNSQTRLSLIDNVMELAEDSTERRFENIADAYAMLVYKDSILIVSNKNPQHGAPLISLYDINGRMHHVADYIPRGSSTNEMTACRIHIAGDELFVSDSYHTGQSAFRWLMSTQERTSIIMNHTSVYASFPIVSRLWNSTTIPFNLSIA